MSLFARQKQGEAVDGLSGGRQLILKCRLTDYWLSGLRVVDTSMSATDV